MRPQSLSRVAVFALSGTEEFGRCVAHRLSIPLAEHEERNFEDGEHKIRSLEDVRNRHVYVIHCLRGGGGQSVNDRLCKLLFFIAALKDAGAGQVSACLPYLAYARKDRRTQLRDPVTSRYVATLFEAIGVDRIIALDVHNQAAYDNAFRCETLHLEAAECFAQHFGSQCDGSAEWVVVSPDIGGVKRAQRFRDLVATQVTRPVRSAFIEKRRGGGVVSGELLAGDVGGRRVLIIDDLISSGGTVLRAVQACRRAGALRIDVAATHAVFSTEAHRLFASDGPDSIAVTDSVALAPEFACYRQRQLAVLSAASLFAEAILEVEGPSTGE